jgi:uncharacterized heparinase superfamily protein
LHRPEVLASNEIVFKFLNTERRFIMPVPWNLPELNTGTRLWKLHLHGFDYTESLDDHVFEDLVIDWITGNPPYSPSYWRDSWNSYALSIRVVGWMGEVARRGDRIRAHILSQMVRSLFEQIQFLQTNLELDIGGNHIIKNIKALYWASSFFDGKLAERCRSLADRLLRSQIDRQILSDGFHFEVSPSYHCQVFGDLMDCWRLIADQELKDLLAKSLHRMAQVTSELTHPDGSIPLVNDGGLHMSWPPRLLLSVYQSLFGLMPTPRQQTWLDESGYLIVRNSRFYLIYDAGLVGPNELPAHAHGDIFSFELSVDGKRVIVDQGVFEYNAGHRRALSRSTKMHNTLTIKNLDQCEFWSSFRMGRRAAVKLIQMVSDGDSILLDGEHNGYAHLSGRPMHRRKLELKPKEGILRIVDMVAGGRGQRASFNLLLHPSADVRSRSPYSVGIECGNTVVELSSERPIRVVDRCWWPDFGVEIATKGLEIDCGPVPGRWCHEFRWLPS